MMNRSARELEKNRERLYRSKEKIQALLFKLQSETDEAREHLRQTERAIANLTSEKDKQLVIKKEPKRLGPT